MGLEMQVALRPAVAVDERFMRTLYGTTRAAEMALVPWAPEQKLAFLDMQFRAQRLSYLNEYPHAEYYLIELSGQPAGRMIVDRSGKTMLLMDIALLPEFQRRGIGTMLIRALQGEALRSGRALRLHVETFNPALRLYERLGFRAVGEIGIYLEMEWSAAEAQTGRPSPDNRQYR